jgi:transcriptional regulator with XRE-family HTH domain
MNVGAQGETGLRQFLLNTISLIERAKTFGGIDALFDIARALDISLSQLLKAAEERADGR